MRLPLKKCLISSLGNARKYLTYPYDCKVNYSSDLLLYLEPSTFQPAFMASPPVAPTVPVTTVTPVAPIASVLSRVRVTHLNTNLFPCYEPPIPPANTTDDSDLDQTTSANATFHSLDPGDL